MYSNIQEYRNLLKRLDDAERYFLSLSDSDIETIESSKDYIVLKQIIYKLCELHLLIKDEI
nr:hypothetical protein [Clostridioides sp.]